MTKVLFICHGNICRSPMAEFVFKDMVKKAGLEDQFVIASCATSTEEIGNLVHPGTRKRLQQEGISTAGKHAVQLRKEDYNKYDYLLGMDAWNMKNIYRIIGKEDTDKVRRLLSFTDRERDIADPWYTGNFDETYNDVVEGCEAFLNFVTSKI
ncbi:low molecular weight protein-tyrosine-phosphatase [Anaerosporobacter sp.]|uniref:low molecular weight protein-tyrosine-phosphatase n=1 Tax=Anaerosporobacter sp. TaxID=1872529 RepID=UPI00286F5765|nr:low molecular weight protein-tyrosine-phosphatase [Anaerosporobacter sp.]